MTTLSIITATYNAATTIADSLHSVDMQTYPCEQIIIDGTSTDGTLEVVGQVTGDVSHSVRVVSEPDRGIYDAMNKGIALASGEVVGILNADDFYASPNVLGKVARIFEDPAVMSCYGDLEYISTADEGRGMRDEKVHSQPVSGFKVIRYWKSGPFSPDRFYWGWMPPHPTFFVRRSVYERFGRFNLDQGSAADYELMLRLLLKERISCVYIPEVLVRMRVGGASNASLRNRLLANRMDRRAWDVNGLKPYPWTVMVKPLRKVLQYICRQT